MGPFSEYTSNTQTSTQYLTKQQGSSVMAGDTYNLISQLQVQTSGGKRDLWDFGSYPERKDDGLLFEKEVLDIQAKEEEGSNTPVEESESGCCGACVTCFCAIGFLSWAFL